MNQKNNFFQILRTYNGFVANTTITSSKKKHTGHDAFGSIYESARSYFFPYYGETQPSSVEFAATYAKFYTKHKDDLGPFFRQLYNLLKMVKESKQPNKKTYTNLVRAQLSSSQLTLLALNVASEFGREKMAPLVKEFDLLKHCDDREFLTNLKLDSHLEDFFEEWEFFRKLIY